MPGGRAALILIFIGAMFVAGFKTAEHLQLRQKGADGPDAAESSES